MTSLGELARLIRSKNAGPFELTFDIMFDDDITYQRVKNSGALTREAVAARMGRTKGPVGREGMVMGRFS